MRRLVSLILVLAAVFSLSACSLQRLEMQAEVMEERVENRLERPHSSRPTAEIKLSADEAEQIALAHAGLKPEDVERIHSGLDHDEGRAEYDVSFYHGRTEYEYEIDAVSGDIISFDIDD